MRPAAAAASKSASRTSSKQSIFSIAARIFSALAQPDLDDAVKAELVSIAGDSDAVTDRFYRDLEFGTGGLRGVIGAGTNRMNLYTVRKATQGLADYLNASGLPKKVAIAHDSRHNGALFARETARVLAANGITACMYPRLEPSGYRGRLYCSWSFSFIFPWVLRAAASRPASLLSCIFTAFASTKSLSAPPDFPVQTVKKLHSCLIAYVGATIGRPPTYRRNAFSGTVVL